MNSKSEEPDPNPYTPSNVSPKSLPADGQAMHEAYWSKSLKVVCGILFLWALISLGCGVLFREFLDSAASVGGAPLGFWMAQQGSIFGFLILLFLYMFLMNRLDREYGFGDEDKQ